MNPITLRQSFQGANFEAIREAQGFNDQLVREAAHRRVMDEHMAEEQANVPNVSGTDPMRTEERQGRGGQTGHPGSGSPEDPADSEETEEGTAIPADGHLDFLA
jgi:hypothetical protein